MAKKSNKNPNQGPKKLDLPPNPTVGKKGKVKGNASGSISATKAAAAAAVEALASPKPTVKQIIGGSSWTGKLPLNLFNEYCQKQQWEKPVYDMRKTPDGFSCWVILSAVDTRTKEKTTLEPFKIPASHTYLITRDTKLEARHCAATYALFRTCSLQNRHTVLPPDYKSLWKEFQALKSIDIKEGRAWMYEADPLKTHREREAAKAVAKKKREEQEAAKAKEKVAPVQPGIVIRGQKLSAEDKAAHQAALAMRGWKNAPRIEMGQKSRAHIESLLRKGSVWNPHGMVFPKVLAEKAVEEFVRLGFRKSHAQEATSYCKDREECLEWLLLHVPEDDLPTWALPEKYMAGIVIGQTDLKREGCIERLSLPGYSKDLCKRVYDENDGDETKAALAMQNMLHPLIESTDKIKLMDTPEQHWKAEVESIESVYGEAFKRISDGLVQVQLENVVNGKAKVKAHLQIRRGPNYPNFLILGISADLPSYIRLSILNKALDYIDHEVKLDEMKMYLIIDFVQENINEIIKNPGKLLDISSVASAASETKPSHKIARGNQRKPRLHFIQWTEDPENREQWLRRIKTKEWVMMEDKRQNLPAWKVQGLLVETVERNDVTIISGETGSGKSTQSMQFILDNLYSRGLGGHANILVTQPRRISALGLADRVAEERCTKVGDEIGYAIRGESKRGRDTKITFMTTGVLLRRLQVAGSNIDDVVASLTNVSHVVIDEVHERSLDTDFLMTILRQVLVARRGLLKLVLMSATLNARSFSEYFERRSLSVGLVEIQGRTHPVTDIYLEEILRITPYMDRHRMSIRQDGDAAIGKYLVHAGTRFNYELAVDTVETIDQNLGTKNRGGILIFLPGIAEINKLCSELSRNPALHVLSLHASLETKDQKRVFQKPPPNKRKVVVATNVAETSITIDDIVAVVDSGKVKEITYDPQNSMRKLEENWASKAACKQRRGRAGRVQEGICYKLYTRKHEQESMADCPEPEIRRVPLEQLCLSVRAMGLRDVAQFLSEAPTPPKSTAVEDALNLLKTMGAMDGDELTALGTQLAMIPADLRCAKLMVYGCIFGCLDDAIAIAAILSTRSPFLSPPTKREESRAARVAFSTGDGDLLTDLAAYRAWKDLQQQPNTTQRNLRAWCDNNFLSYNTLTDIFNTISQYRDALIEAGLISPAALREATAKGKAAAASSTLLRALTASAFSPQIARVQLPEQKFHKVASGAVEADPEARLIKYFTNGQGRVFVHPSSVLFDSQSFLGRAVFVSYFTMISTSKVFIRDLTPFNAYTLLLFAGTLSLDTLGRGLIVDGWLYLQGWARIGVLVARLRSLIDSVVARKINNPFEDVSDSDIIKTVIRLVEYDGLDA